MQVFELNHKYFRLMLTISIQPFMEHVVFRFSAVAAAQNFADVMREEHTE